MVQRSNDLRARIACLEDELDALRARYDTLAEAHARAAEHYKADYKKWRDFKRWLLHNIDADSDRVRSFLKGGQSVAHAASSSAPRKRKLSEDERDAKAEPCRSSTVALTPRHRRRKSYRGDTSLSSSPSNAGRLPPPVPKNSTERFAEIPCKAEHSLSTPLTEPRKRRGRYAQVPSNVNTINSRFSIRKDRNSGVDFQYDAVVRDRNERKHMLGSDCECCREYYEAVGPLPASRQPLWQTPTKRKTPCILHASDDDKENPDQVEKHKQLISRHRHHWHRPKTPPGYWDIGFPDTQEVLDINRRAAEMHKRKLVQVEADARNNNGRYVERAQRLD